MRGPALLWVFTITAILGLAPTVHADVRVPKVFGSHMVLQQEQPIPVWGWADPGEKVEVSLGMATVATTADTQGVWRVDLPTMKADGKPLSLKIAGHNTVEFADVLLGEVWICGGQSNMGRPVSNEAANGADVPLLRLFNSSGNFPRKEGMDDVTPWIICTPTSILTAGDSLGPGKGRRPFSEVAYHFGLKLQQTLKVPVGLLQVNCGGSTAADWTPFPEIGAQLPLDQPVDKITHKQGLLYWVRLRGIIPFSTRGVIWYQGEDDGRNGNYFADLRNLIESWRALWKRPDLPFYMAQIQPTTYAGGMLGVWEAQVRALNEVPHTGLAVSNDIYDTTNNSGFKERIDPKSGWPIAGGSDPHPTGRPLVAERLADIALVKLHGQPAKPICGPLFESQELQGNKIVIKFKNTGSGLTTRDGKEPDWFEISDGTLEGNHPKYVKAVTHITGTDTVEVSADGMSAPKYTRMGWNALARFNLKNKEGLPAVTFRTEPLNK